MGRPKKEPINTEETVNTLTEVSNSAYAVAESLQELRERLAAAKMRLAITHLEKKIAKAQKPDIDEAIVRVIAKVGRVKKNGFNDFHKYEYVKAADIIEEIRKAVAEEGITILPLGITDEVRTPTNGRNGDIVSGVQVYRLTGPDGSFKDVPVKAAGQDGGDKVYYKFATGAMKYLYIQVFLIPQGDDPEDEKGRAPENDNQGKNWKEKNNTSNQGNNNNQANNNAPAATNQQAAEPAKPAEKPFLGKKGVEKCEEMIKAGQITEARKYLLGFQLSEKANTHLKQVFAAHTQKPAETAVNKPVEAAEPAEQAKPAATPETPAKAPKQPQQDKPAPTPAVQKTGLPESTEFSNEAPVVEHTLPDDVAHQLFKMIDDGQTVAVRAELNRYKLKPEARAAYKQRLEAKEAELNQVTQQPAPAAAKAPAEADNSGIADAELKTKAIELSKNPAIPRRFKTDMLLKINVMTVNQVNEHIENMKDMIELASQPAE